jgi:hypothetical protein
MTDLKIFGRTEIIKLAVNNSDMRTRTKQILRRPKATELLNPPL